MICRFKGYNPKKDLQEVDQFGYTDLVKAFQNGYVPGEAESIAEGFNEIEDPASIIGKPSDAFEAMRMQDAIIASQKSNNASSGSEASSSDSD